MLRAVLSLLHQLIVFGYYTDPKDVSLLMGPLKGKAMHSCNCAAFVPQQQLGMHL